MAASQKKNSLFLLPDELLVDIVKETSWKDVLALRKTCQRFFNITKALEIWQVFGRRESRQALCLELPIELYSSEQLEHLILRRKSAEFAYEKSENGFMASPPQRVLPINTLEDPRDADVCLIPGGRWLLASTLQGSVEYYDLDSEDCVGHQLLPRKNVARHTFIRIDIDQSSLKLRFNLVLATFESHLDLDDHQAVIEVWQVDLVVDEEGRGVGLAVGADPLNRFLQEPKGYIQYMAFIGEHLAYAILRRENFTTYGFVVDWKTVRGGNHPKRIVHVPGDSYFCLLDDYICVSNGCKFSLISLESLEELITIPQNYAQNPQVICSIILSQPIRTSTISHPVIRKEVNHFVAATFDAVYAIIVHTGHGSPSIQATHLADIPSGIVGKRIPVSDDFCLMWFGDRQMLLQSISQPRFKSPLPLLPRFPAVMLYFYRLDMASGRILISQGSREGRKLTVLYLGLQ